MSSTTENKVSLAVIAGAAAIAVAVVAIASSLSGRMPPDPFEEEGEPREVILEVEWEGEPRRQRIAYDVGDDEAEFETEGEPDGEGARRWTHITTAAPDTIARLSAIQVGGRGDIMCAIYVDEIQIAADGTRFPGCFVEVTIP